MRRLVLVVILVSACGGTAATTTTTTQPTTTTEATETIEGSLLLKQLPETVDQQGCSGREGYDDIREGAQVTVKDETGTLVATSQLGSGHQQPILEGSTIGFCLFEFSVTVPADLAFYSVEVSHRGELTYSAADLEEMGWVVELELGG